MSLSQEVLAAIAVIVAAAPQDAQEAIASITAVAGSTLTPEAEAVIAAVAAMPAVEDTTAHAAVVAAVATVVSATEEEVANPDALTISINAAVAATPAVEDHAADEAVGNIVDVINAATPSSEFSANEEDVIAAVVAVPEAVVEVVEPTVEAEVVAEAAPGSVSDASEEAAAPVVETSAEVAPVVEVVLTPVDNTASQEEQAAVANANLALLNPVVTVDTSSVTAAVVADVTPAVPYVEPTPAPVTRYVPVVDSVSAGNVIGFVEVTVPSEFKLNTRMMVNTDGSIGAGLVNAAEEYMGRVSINTVMGQRVFVIDAETPAQAFALTSYAQFAKHNVTTNTNHKYGAMLTA